ncbi:MAG: hypothetical protein M5U34_04130 [Chloroflexi bacterium]|nr:hypothetical protein [Chloroflexota bacterium]
MSNESGTIQIISPFTSPDDYYVTPDGTEGDTFFPPQQIKGTPLLVLSYGIYFP